MAIKLTKKNIIDFKKAIKKTYGCKSQWIESVPVKEVFENQTVWSGIVEVFKLIDCSTASKCYAWFYDDKEKGKRKFIVVLHQIPVDSPEKAVKAAIINEFKKK